VRRVDRYGQSQSIILSSFPKHLLRVGSLMPSQLLPEFSTFCKCLLTCEMTTVPSFAICKSVSIACAPTSTAPLNAPIVFSGNAAL
jgi:hypothetical protein